MSLPNIHKVMAEVCCCGHARGDHVVTERSDYECVWPPCDCLNFTHEQPRAEGGDMPPAATWHTE